MAESIYQLNQNPQEFPQTLYTTQTSWGARNLDCHNVATFCNLASLTG